MSITMDQIVAAIPPIATFLGVVITAILSLMTAMRTTVVATKVDEVHKNTDGYLSRLETQLQISNAALASATQQVVAGETSRVLLASEAAIALRDVPIPVAAPPQIIVVSDKGTKLG